MIRRTVSASACCLTLLLVQCWVFGLTAQEEARRSTRAFESAKGRLTCPIVSGTIDKGKIYLDAQTQQTLGIDIYSASDSVVAVFEGVVVSSFEMGKENFAIVVSHGDYFSVYSGLRSSMVASKQMVQQGAFLGTAKKEDEQYMMHLEIWKGSDKIQPTFWLSCE